MKSIDNRERLRAILHGDRCVVASSVFDPISARIGDALGFEAGVLGGSVASLAVLGAPDLILLTLTELAEQVRRVCRAGKLCVLVDADHGYGNALNTMRAVEELQDAGAAGISIEDTVLPRAFGASDAPQLIGLDEGVGKMKAAVRARGDSGMAIFGRTIAASVAGVDEAIRRLLAYEHAGVDALFIPGLKSRRDLDLIANAVNLPLILGGPGPELLGDTAYLASRKVRVLLAGHQPFAAAVQALYQAIGATHGGPLPAKTASADALVAQLSEAAQYERYIDDYMGRGVAPHPKGKGS